MDRFPNSYKHVKELLPSLNGDVSTKIFSIQLHLVRAKVNSVNLKTRFTNDTWYLEILDRILFYLDANKVDYEILLHTDVSANPSWNIPLGMNPVTLEYWNNNGIKINDNFMEISTNDVLKNFKKYKNLKIVTGIDPVEAWSLLSQADLFLMGKSSFSYVGAIYNVRGIVVSPKFWHSAPSWWHVVKENNQLSLDKACSRIVKEFSNL
jgi:hypothetical protein